MQIRKKEIAATMNGASLCLSVVFHVSFPALVSATHRHFVAVVMLVHKSQYFDALWVLHPSFHN